MGNNIVQRFERNTKGRDLIIGDIRGCFTKMGTALRAVGFDPEEGDRLFSVGNMCGEGPESRAVLDFIAQDFVHAVSGSHEAMAVCWPHATPDGEIFAANGASWMLSLDRETKVEVSHALSKLPLAIELETEAGLIGIVHAECPMSDWQAFTGRIDGTIPAAELTRTVLIDFAQWSRGRAQNNLESIVSGVRYVVVGHTWVTVSKCLGNTIFIDTRGWSPNGKFTILDAATMRQAKRPERKS